MSGAARSRRKSAPFSSPTDEPTIVEAVKSVGGHAVLTRPGASVGLGPHSSRRSTGSIRRARHDVVVNVQGDLPTIERRGLAGRLAPLLDERSTSRRWRRRSGGPRKCDDPNVVKAVGTEIAPGRLTGALFHPRPSALGRGRLLHHIGLYAYRRAALAAVRLGAALAARAAREARAVARARGGHAHRHRARRPGAARRRHAPRNWSGRGPLLAPEERQHDRDAIHRLSGRARRQFAYRLRRQLSRS